MPVEIRKFDGMPQSRQSRYCFGLQNDSVFADFNLDAQGRIFLLGISFDGYGYCGTAKDSSRMSLSESAHFVNLIENDLIISEEFIELLLCYFNNNKGVIWEDALKEHKLLPD